MIWNPFHKPAPFNDTPRQKLYTVALSESITDLTDHWRGENLMTIAATSPEEARQQALSKAKRLGIVLDESSILDVRGGERDA